MTDLGATLPGVGGGLVFDAYGGAINAVAPDATAFVHRDAVCCVQATVATGTAASAVAAGRAWLAHLASVAAPYVDGSAYQNYIDPTLADWQQRLLRGEPRPAGGRQGAYDADDVFRFAQSIPTSQG